LGANTRTVLRLLLESRVDVALVEGPVSHPQVDVHPWREDELVVISHPEHELLSRTYVDVAMLVREQFIVREPGSGTREVSERALALHGARLSNTMRVGGTEAIKQAVAAGLGMAIVSRAAAADQLALGKIAVLSVNRLEMRRTLAQIKLHGRVTTAAGRELEQLLAHQELDAISGDASGTPT
jgi:DNA-binding transcriptional LysR family regulator